MPDYKVTLSIAWAFNTTVEGVSNEAEAVAIAVARCVEDFEDGKPARGLDVEVEEIEDDVEE